MSRAKRRWLLDMDMEPDLDAAMRRLVDRPSARLAADIDAVTASLSGDGPDAPDAWARLLAATVRP